MPRLKSLWDKPGLQRSGDPDAAVPPPVTRVGVLVDTGTDVKLLPRAALAPLDLHRSRAIATS